MSSTERANQRVCFIGGAGHSGSTLLGLIIGSHRHAFYAGEAGKTRYLHNPRKDMRKRVCKICGPDCPIWSDFHVRDDIDLYEQLSRKTGASVIIDSTKKLKWITEHIEELSETSATPCFIFLQRDGRAIINSRVRKYPEKDPVEHIEKWSKQIGQTQDFYDVFRYPKMTLQYERLATEPEAATRQLCSFLELDFDSSMLDFYKHEHHPLGGNNGTQSIVARHHGPNPDRPYSQVGERSRDYYSKHVRGIQLDLRWLEELPQNILEEFEKRAGDINRPMQWEPGRQ